MATNRSEQYYMMFYRDLSLLHSIHNKQTLFFSELMANMDSNQIVQLTPYLRKEIMNNIGSNTKDQLATCRQMLNKLVKANLITCKGGGAYMINPRICGHNNMRDIINKKEKVYLKVKYTSPENREFQVGVLEDIHSLENK